MVSRISRSLVNRGVCTRKPFGRSSGFSVKNESCISTVWSVLTVLGRLPSWSKPYWTFPKVIFPRILNWLLSLNRSGGPETVRSIPNLHSGASFLPSVLIIRVKLSKIGLSLGPSAMVFRIPRSRSYVNYCLNNAFSFVGMTVFSPNICVIQKSNVNLLVEGK